MRKRNILFIICAGALILTCIGVALIVKREIKKQVVSHQLITTDGYAIDVREYGVSSSKYLLVLFPNASQPQSELSSVALSFQNEGFAVVTMDWRGEADQSNDRYSSAEWGATTNDVKAVVEYATQHYPDSTLVLAGGGFGANQALIYAADHTTVAGVFALSPRTSIHGSNAAQAMRSYTGPLIMMEYRSADPSDDQTYPGDELLKTSVSSDKLYLSTPNMLTGFDMISGEEVAIHVISQWIREHI